MSKQLTISLCFLLAFMQIQYKKDSGINALEIKGKILEYKFTHGWTGIVSSIEIFADKSALRYVDSNKVDIEFSEKEKKDLDTLLLNIPSFKRIYQPQSGAWSDISTHELIHYQVLRPDTVSIYEPIDSQDIPIALRNSINLFMSKL